MSQAQSQPRLHSLDALRAAMMLLGLVLHSAASYTTFSLEAAWPYQDAQRTGVADWLVFIIHLFRMPAFFVMAGFFAAFLYYREGVRGFLAHRARRLLLPLIAGWVIVFPLVRSGFAYAVYGGGHAGLDAATQLLTTAPYAAPTLAHLWFIYDLLIFCVAAVIVVPQVERLSPNVRSASVNAFARLTPTLGGCLLLGVVTTVTLFPMSKPGLDTSISWVPAPRVLIAYGVFFTFGWLVFVRRELVSTIGHRPWFYFAAAFVMSVAYMMSVVAYTGTPAPAGFVRSIAIAGGDVALDLRGDGPLRPVLRAPASAAALPFRRVLLDVHHPSAVHDLDSGRARVAGAAGDHQIPDRVVDDVRRHRRHVSPVRAFDGDWRVPERTALRTEAADRRRAADLAGYRLTPGVSRPAARLRRPRPGASPAACLRRRASLRMLR